MNAAEIARRMETDAVDFYREAAGRTSSPVGRKMFLSIAEDEERHIRMIDALLKGLDIKEGPVDPMQRIKTVFQEMKDQMQEAFAATTGEKEALAIAMNMEKKGCDFYAKAAAEAKDEKSKALFTRLVKEEEKHHSIFSNTLSFLEDSGNWFMWSEHSIVEG